MRIERIFRPAGVDYKITTSDAEFILTSCGEVAPKEYLLYIWVLPFDQKGSDMLMAAIAQITGKEVKAVQWRSDNGHGVVNVDYEEQ